MAVGFTSTSCCGGIVEWCEVAVAMKVPKSTLALALALSKKDGAEPAP